MAGDLLSPKLRAGLVTTVMEAADAAGEAILPYFRTVLPVENKAEGARFDPVTVADREAESAIRAVIRHYHPDHQIIGEEFGTDGPAFGGASHGQALTWVIDPIDGTRAFIAGAPTWGTLIGAGTPERPVIGLMDQPYVGDRYLGLPGTSMTFGPQGSTVLSASSVTRIEDAILAATAPDMFKGPGQLSAFARIAQTARLTRFGLDCTAYCLLASGHIDLVVETGLKIYDIYPLVPIIEGAGGVITDWRGGPVHQGGHAVAAATPELHAAALDILLQAA